MKISPRYEDILIGTAFEFTHTVIEEDESLFIKLTTDSTRLYSDQVSPEYPAGKKIVHGMLAASFFSTLIDLYSLGPSSLYVKQTLQFRKPIFYGDLITIRGTIVDKNDVFSLVTMRTEILRNKEIMISGEGIIKILV